MEKAKSHETEISVEERLRALYSLQLVDSEIDKIKTLRGELPLEVQDLEDEIAGLETRLGNLREEVVNLEKAVSKKNNEITDAEALIKKYEEQQKNVRNNREFDSLSKEIEFQNLEIELFNKKIKEFTAQIDEKKTLINDSEATHRLHPKSKCIFPSCFESHCFWLQPLPYCLDGLPLSCRLYIDSGYLSCYP